MPAKKAAKKGPVASKNLSVPSGKNATFTTLVKNLQRELTKVKCGGCRSGFEKIVFADPVIFQAK